MREIKFKFWDQAKQIMTSEHPDATIWWGQLVCEADIVPMQYTGLKDSKNQEIYEGDILKITNYKSQVQKMELICIVDMGVFGAYHALIIKVNKWEKYNAKPPVDDKPLYFLNIIGSKEYEIIGNIHENPELLEDENLHKNKLVAD